MIVVHNAKTYRVSNRQLALLVTTLIKEKRQVGEQDFVKAGAKELKTAPVLTLGDKTADQLAGLLLDIVTPKPAKPRVAKADKPKATKAA